MSATGGARQDPREVVVLPFRIDAGAARAALHLLTHDERTRAARFRVAHAHDTYVVARATLRVLLGRRLAVAPHAVAFHHGEHGKPYVDQAHHLDFNVSHSGDLVVLAITSGTDVGVDVETIGTFPEMAEVAARHFQPVESHDIAAAGPLEGPRAFTRCWAQKEAVLKAAGTGLFASLHGFRVPVTGLLGTTRVPTFLDRPWMVHEVDVAPTCATAVAYAGETRPVRVAPLLPASSLFAGA